MDIKENIIETIGLNITNKCEANESLKVGKSYMINDRCYWILGFAGDLVLCEYMYKFELNMVLLNVSDFNQAELGVF